jgi:hypothetical protein
VAARRFPVEAGHVLAFGRALGLADELAVGRTFETVVVEDLKRTQIVNGEGTEVVSGYAHARLAR